LAKGIRIESMDFSMKKASVLYVVCQNLNYTPRGFFLSKKFPEKTHKKSPRSR
jgi:hypothetical protein